MKIHLMTIINQRHDDAADVVMTSHSHLCLGYHPCSNLELHMEAQQCDTW